MSMRRTDKDLSVVRDFSLGTFLAFPIPKWQPNNRTWTRFLESSLPELSETFEKNLFPNISDWNYFFPQNKPREIQMILKQTKLENAEKKNFWQKTKVETKKKLKKVFFSHFDSSTTNKKYSENYRSTKKMARCAISRFAAEFRFLFSGTVSSSQFPGKRIVLRRKSGSCADRRISSPALRWSMTATPRPPSAATLSPSSGDRTLILTFF
jgi:hypothetical protein